MLALERKSSFALYMKKEQNTFVRYETLLCIENTTTSCSKTNGMVQKKHG